jgi:hypothetical protein
MNSFFHYCTRKLWRKQTLFDTLKHAVFIVFISSVSDIWKSFTWFLDLASIPGQFLLTTDQKSVAPFKNDPETIISSLLLR